MIRWRGRSAAVSALSTIAIDGDESTLQAIGDCITGERRATASAPNELLQAT
jgi:hypothetical protein